MKGGDKEGSKKVGKDTALSFSPEPTLNSARRWYFVEFHAKRAMIIWQTISRLEPYLCNGVSLCATLTRGFSEIREFRNQN